MSIDLPVRVKDLIPTPAGTGVFLARADKCIALFIDSGVAAAMRIALSGRAMPRPMTHPLMVSMMTALGVRLEKVVIHDRREDVYFARIYLSQENELGKGLYEIDARPSDAIVLALLQQAPILVSESVWNGSPDMTWALENGATPPHKRDEPDGSD